MQFLQGEGERRNILWIYHIWDSYLPFWSVKTEKAPPDVIFTDFGWLIEVKWPVKTLNFRDLTCKDTRPCNFRDIIGKKIRHYAGVAWKLTVPSCDICAQIGCKVLKVQRMHLCVDLWAVLLVKQQLVSIAYVVWPVNADICGLLGLNDIRLSMCPYILLGRHTSLYAHMNKSSYGM